MSTPKTESSTYISTSVDPSLSSLTALAPATPIATASTNNYINDNTEIITVGNTTVIVNTPNEVFVNVTENFTSQQFITNNIDYPAGATGELQFNEGGNLAADTELSFDINTKVLAAGSVSTDNLLYANGQPWDFAGQAANTGNIRFSGDNVTSINNTVSISGGDYVQLESGGAYVIAQGGEASIVASGGRTWAFDTAGNLTLPTNNSRINYANGEPYAANTGNTGFIGDAIYNINGVILENADLSHGATAAVILPSNGNSDPILVQNIYGNVRVGTSANGIGGLTSWTFDSAGVINLPVGRGYTYNAPLVGYGSGAEVQFELNSDPSGTETQWMASVIIPGTGYAIGDEYTFDSDFLQIPDASVTITVAGIDGGGGVTDLAFTSPPLYPTSLYRQDGFIALQANDKRWTFGLNGRFTYPDRTYTTGSNVTVPVGNTFAVTTSSIESVSAPCFIAEGDRFVADIENNDDITVVQAGWTVNVGGTIYTVTDIDPSPPIGQYIIIAAGATFVEAETYTFTDPVSASHTWSIDQYGVLTAPGNGTISQINNDFFISVANTDVIGLRTEGGDVILDAQGNLNIPGELISTTSASRLSLNENGGGGAYLTSTDNDTTAVFLRTNDVQMYAGINQTILAGTILPGLETDYTDSRIILEDLFTQNAGLPGYPWGITLPVSYATYGELILLPSDTFPNQDACTVYANNTNNRYELWQGTISETNVTITANENNWVFDGYGNLTLPTNTSSINYANGQPYGGGGGGNASALVNGDNSFVLDSAGNVVFEGTPSGNAVDRGLVWDYGANANGVNSMVRQDNNGITVRAWTENGGGANGYSAPVNIITNQDANTNTWRFDGQGNLTLPGNLNIPTGNIVSNIITPSFTSGITGINSGNANVIITVADELFEGPISGQVTISNVNSPVMANGDWWYQATDWDQFQLFTDANLTTPVDGTMWPGYVDGGTAVGTGTYSNLTVQAGNVSIRSNDQTWQFDTTGNLTVPSNGSIIAINDGGQLGSQILLNPELGQTKLAARSTEYTQNFTSTDWIDAEYTGSQVNITDAPGLLGFVANNSTFNASIGATFSINGGEPVLYQGFSDTGSNNVIIYTNVAAEPDPTTVTTIDFYYQLESYIGVDYDGTVDIYGAGLTINIDNDQTQGPDINIRSGDDILLQAKDKNLGTESEGGDINIYAGDGAGDDGQGNTSSGGGDIQIIAGVGGFGNTSSGSTGGFAALRGGQGGIAGVSSNAGSGGYVQISAGSGGSNNGDSQFGAGGGYVSINAGDSTQQGVNGGAVTISSGLAGSGALAGNVEITTPVSDLGDGGTWRFDGSGNLTLPSTGNINGADGSWVRIQSLESGNIRSGMSLNPGYGITRLESWDNQNSQGFTTTDWATGEYIDNGGAGEIAFTNTPAIRSFFDTIFTSRLFYQVNGGNLLPSVGWGGGGDNIVFYTTVPPATSPETVNDFVIYYSNKSTIEMDYDEGEMNIISQGLDINIQSDQSIDMISNDIIRIQNSGNTSGVAIITNPTNGFNTWNFGANGSVTLPTISLGESTDEQTVISSQRKLIPPFRWSAVIDGATPTVVYNATNVNTTSMKVTMQIQHQGLGMEFFEVFATTTGADTYYTVGSRVAPPTIDPSTVVVELGSSNIMQITVTINSGVATSWVTYDAVEFGIPND